MQNIYSWMVFIFWDKFTCTPRFSSMRHSSIVGLYTNLIIVLVPIQHSFSLQQLLLIVILAVLAVLLVILISHVLWLVAVDILWHFKSLATRKEPLINTVYWTFQQCWLLCFHIFNISDIICSNIICMDVTPHFPSRQAHTASAMLRPGLWEEKSMTDSILLCFSIQMCFFGGTVFKIIMLRLLTDAFQMVLMLYKSINIDMIPYTTGWSAGQILTVATSFYRCLQTLTVVPLSRPPMYQTFQMCRYHSIRPVATAFLSSCCVTPGFFCQFPFLKNGFLTASDSWDHFWRSFSEQ